MSDSERPKIDLKLMKSNISSSFLINLNALSGEKPLPIAETISLALKRQEGSLAFSERITFTPPALLSMLRLTLSLFSIYCFIFPSGPTSTPILSSGILINKLGFDIFTHYLIINFICLTNFNF